MKQRRFRLRLAVLFGCILAFVVSSVSPAIATPPENDNIESAVVIDALPYQAVQDTSEASWSDGSDPSCLGGVTVWYTFTPTSEIGLDINTFGSDYNTTLGVFWGDPSNPLMSSFGCTDDAQVTFSAPAGLKLYIGVGAHQPLGGNLVLSATQIPPPANDDFANAKVIAALPFSETLDLSGATRDPGQPSAACSQPLKHSVWYTFTPADDAPVTATLVKGVVGVFRGTSIADLAEVACSQPGTTPLTVQLIGDTAYYFAVSGDNAIGGVVTFNLTDAPSPVADFHYYPWNPTTLSPTSFTDDSFDPGGRTFATRLWDFGDGASASGCCPAHQFAADGDYTVTLTVTTTDGRTDSASLVVPVRTPTPSPVANFHYDPPDPSRVSTISFTDDSIDPAGQTFVSTLWYFGEGASASGCCPNHQYAEDGDYAVTLTVTTTDGRTDNRTRIVSVRTHDVAIVSVDVPKVGVVGSTKTVNVYVASGDYTENVQVYLSRSVPGGFETVDLQTQTIPASTTAAFRFAYTFTSSDASLGTIAFQAHAVITDHVDPIPVDNVLTSANVKVVGKR
jgi:PKD repeat protein